MPATRLVEVSLVSVGLGSILRVLFVGSACFYVPLYLIAVALTLAGCPIGTADTVIDNEAVSGIESGAGLLLGAVLLPPVLALSVGLPLWIGLGLFRQVRSWLGPLRVKAVVEDEPPSG